MEILRICQVTPGKETAVIEKLNTLKEILNKGEVFSLGEYGWVEFSCDRKYVSTQRFRFFDGLIYGISLCV